MDIQWRYVKTLGDKNLIEDFESAMVYTFNDTFKKCVLANNGGRPSKSTFDTDKTREREMKSLLSFNETDKENVWNVNQWVKSDLKGQYIAFAIDNFGNLICFDGNNDNVVFWDHETNNIELIAKNFDEFLSKLYD